MPSDSYKSVVEMFRDRVSSTPDARAMLFKRDGAWTHLSWRQVNQRVHDAACGLRALGLESEQRCSILARTRPEWVLADLAILSAAGATTTIYPSSPADDCAYIIQDSATRFVFVDDAELAERLRSLRAELPTVERLITLTDGADGDWVISLEQLEELGRSWDQEHPGAIQEIGDQIDSHHLATLIYTSGTTGRPKGVMLTHDNWVYEGEAIDNLDVLLPSDVLYLFLPLAHSFAKVMQLCFIRMGIPTVVDGDQSVLMEQLSETRPTFMSAVPRFFEKVHAEVLRKAKADGSVSWATFQWAMAVGRQVSVLRQQGREPRGLLAVQHRLADKLVLSRIKALFGGRMRFFISGGAPLPKPHMEFFHAADLLILEGYGLTETSAATFVNRLGHYKFGTVGRALRGSEARVADDGEILLKGRGIMRGYHQRPDDTGDAFTADGWLATGDIGRIDSDGFLTITDRKKDIIVTAGGKNVAPQNIESRLKARCSLLSHVVLHGDQRRFCTALVTVDEDAAGSWAREQQLPFSSYSELAALPELRRQVQDAVDAVNSQLASFETIKDFQILDQPLSIDAGELTPKLSIKRRVVETNHRAILDAFYPDETEGE